MLQEDEILKLEAENLGQSIELAANKHEVSDLKHNMSVLNYGNLELCEELTTVLDRDQHVRRCLEEVK